MPLGQRSMRDGRRKRVDQEKAIARKPRGKPKPAPAPAQIWQPEQVAEVVCICKWNNYRTSCGRCGGTGLEPNTNDAKCSQCHGSGAFGNEQKRKNANEDCPVHGRG